METSSGYGEDLFKTGDRSVIIANYRFWDFQYSHAMNEIKEFLIKLLTTTRENSTDIQIKAFNYKLLKKVSCTSMKIQTKSPAFSFWDSLKVEITGKQVLCFFSTSEEVGEQKMNPKTLNYIFSSWKYHFEYIYKLLFPFFRENPEKNPNFLEK